MSASAPVKQKPSAAIGVIAHGYQVAEVPATIHKRKVGESKKGHNTFYALHFASVIARTWWRERQRRGGSARRSPASSRDSGSSS